jgi:hypothetical protein
MSLKILDVRIQRKYLLYLSASLYFLRKYKIKDRTTLIRMHEVMGKKNLVLPFSIRISPGSLKRGIFPPEKCQIRPDIIKTTPIMMRDLLVVSILKL